jgi:hypothetical protein
MKYSNEIKSFIAIAIGLIYFAFAHLIYSITNELPPPTFWFYGILIAFGGCLYIFIDYQTNRNKPINVNQETIEK